jgi:ankyrin repeat protein
MRRRLMKSGHRELPLHLALAAPSANAPPDDVVLKLLTAFPAASSCADRNGELPLHLAIRCRKSLPVLKRIAAEYQPAIRARNTAGDLPLHVAVQQVHDQYRCPFDTIAWLVEQYPHACSSVDSAQELPLHVAVRTGATPATIHLLVLQCSAACREGDQHGDWPLHSAVRARAELEVTELLVTAESHATHVQCSRGQLPLHVGIVSGAAMDVLIALVDEYPSAVRQRDRTGDLPLHLAMEHGPLELVERLLLAYPESVREPNHSGVQPMRWAEHKRAAQAAGAEQQTSIDTAQLLDLLDVTDATNQAILHHHETHRTLPALGGSLPAVSTIDAPSSAVLAASGQSRVVEETTEELSRGLSLVGQIPDGRLRARAFLRYRQSSAVQTEWAVRHET